MVTSVGDIDSAMIAGFAATGQVMRLLFPLLLLALASCADNDELRVSQAWITAGPPNAPVLAGYLRIDNAGQQAWTLTAAEAPDFGAVELHEMTHEGGMMRMREVDSLPVPAGGHLALEPHGRHLMLKRPARPLAPGDSVNLTLHLRDAAGAEQTLPVRLSVREPGHPG